MGEIINLRAFRKYQTKEVSMEFKPFRPCTCLDCGYQFDWVVKPSETTQNLSGEKTIYCTACNSKQVMAGPIERSGHTFTAGTGYLDDHGQIVMAKQKSIKQADMTASCWSIQIWGAGYCETCPYLDTADCGGEDILAAIKAGQFPATGLPDQSKEVPGE